MRREGNGAAAQASASGTGNKGSEKTILTKGRRLWQQN